MNAPRRATGLLARKSVETMRDDRTRHGLKQVLGPLNLVLLGVGGIVGSGVYVMTGQAAARYAGPGVMLSFVIAGVACALIALCYAELASTAPATGAAYTYTYMALGEVFAWSVGWLILMDFGLAGASLAVGWAAYLVSLLHSFGIILPAVLTSPTFHAVGTGTAIVGGHSFNLVAMLVYGAVIAVLIAGISESSTINAVLVVIKVTILLIFVAIGVQAVHPSNWTPLIPPNEGGFTYGLPGIARAASMLFFAYNGFEMVANAASETRNPQRDLPIGILGAVVVCTVIYLMVSAVMTGLVPFRELGASDALAHAADRIGRPQLALLVKVGGLVGISSVLLINAYGQSRTAFAVSRDGLLPPLFCRLHPKLRTPHLGILVLGLVSAVMAATLPLSLLTDMVSLGSALCFSVVAIAMMWLRATRPELDRPFKVPFGGVRIGRFWIGVVPVGAIVLAWAMMVPVILDLGMKARSGDPFPAAFISSYIALGAVIYLTYGRRRSRVGPLATPGEVLDAPGHLP
ncbi:amino acid permease [Phenylobacterium sp.]|jgi:APA family basic amino acid/polyamine antiporter|uniref:amino acid permease n=1 Tax=Phenylobacterium sp. TaxID=1871053 RepID=UPI002E3076E6|nr:amino acid permease [Phenylobacterium sp.]HEX3367459.1 amino acid permease [Phenylobacterium sp.]